MGSIVMEVFSKIIFLSKLGWFVGEPVVNLPGFYLSNLASITPGAAGATPSEAELDLLSSSSALEDPLSLSTWFFEWCL